MQSKLRTAQIAYNGLTLDIITSMSYNLAMKRINEATYKKDINMGEAYYLVRWSSYFKYDKFDILKKVPEMPGLFVLLYLNKYKRLTPFYLGNSWLGSLRHDIKYFLDEPDLIDKAIAKIIDDEECYYKYLLVESHQDMKDIYCYYKYYYKNVKHVDNNISNDSGRYGFVYVKEYDIKPT